MRGVPNQSRLIGPQAGRMWFESVIRDHLAIGRPDQIAFIFVQTQVSQYNRRTARSMRMPVSAAITRTRS
jgi:hypothetical protein